MIRNQRDTNDSGWAGRATVSGPPQDPAAYILGSLRIGQFLVDGNGHKHLFKQLPEGTFVYDGDEIAERRGVGHGDHAAKLLARAAARRGFKQRRFTIQIGFPDHRQGNTVLAPKIPGLYTGQAKHFRDLVESQSLVAVALQGESFECTARDIPTGGKPLSNVIGDVEGNFHDWSL